MKGYMYILLCNDGSYYTGSTNNLELRLQQHFAGEGANHTKKHPPVKLLYYEEFDRIDEVFYREKQVQGWSRKKKEALIHREYEKLPELSRNYTQYGRPELSVVSASSTTEMKASSTTDDVTSTTDDATVPELVEGTATEPVEGTIVEHFETSRKK